MKKFKFFIVLIVILLIFSFDFNKNQTLNENYLMYQRWFNTSDISNVAVGWKLNLEKTIEVIDCNKPESRFSMCYLKDEVDDKFNKILYIINIKYTHPYRGAGAWSYSGDAWEDFNQELLEKYGISLNEKLLFKASHLLRVPLDQIAISLDTYCFGFSFVYNKNKVKTSRGWTNCQAAHIGTTITPIVNPNIILNCPRAENFIQQNLSEFKNIIHTFFKEKYRDNRIRYISSLEDFNFLQFEVDNLRSEVIKDSNLWEKLQISIIFFQNNPELFNIRMIVDGQYSSGLRRPRSLFLYKDMEPIYYKYLDTYTKELMTNLKSTIEKDKIQ